MHRGKSRCLVCGKENEFTIRTNNNEANGDTCIVIEENNNGTFKCEIDVKCESCGLRYRVYKDIDFK